MKKPALSRRAAEATRAALGSQQRKQLRDLTERGGHGKDLFHAQGLSGRPWSQVSERRTCSGSVVIVAAIASLTASAPRPARGVPQGVAQLIAFLASDAAAYITGSEYLVDGGRHLNR
ncbi:SDR family oxidoreductase [Streptomyces sp. NPDC056352]|uniref:SDR family oxidoreductase n=1 Tax=Streptomyces sp. NPDC056352 TaxID=3345791 RepID=UPI0035D91FF8